MRFDQPGPNVGHAPILWQFGLWAYGGPMVNVTTGTVETTMGYTNACSAPATRGAWNHVAVVLGPEASPSNRLYLNGQFVCQVAGSANVPAATLRRALALGAVDCCYYNFPNFSGFFRGDIDEARLSSSQRYTSDFTPPLRFAPDSQTIGLWHFDEMTGTTALDASGNGYHFALAGGYSWISDSVVTPTATFTTYGTSCNTTFGAPQLTTAPNSTPSLGQTLQLRLSNLPTNSAQLPFGFFATRNESAIGLPLPFSMARYGMNADCLQYVDPDSGLVFTLVNNAGSADWDLSIPNDPALLQLAVFFQGLVLDWNLTTALPAASTNAGVATIGR